MKAGALAAVALSACFGKGPEAPSSPEAPIFVKVWADEAVGGNKAVMDGCKLWKGLIECVPVDDWHEADVTFFRLLIPGNIVGLAYPGVVIIDTELRASYMNECIAHEIGHEVGIAHVPLYGPVQPGQPMGRAVMNPVLAYHHEISEADRLAFRLAHRKMYE